MTGQRRQLSEGVSHPSNEQREMMRGVDRLATEPGFDGEKGEGSGLWRLGLKEEARVFGEERRGEGNGVGGIIPDW